MSVAPAAVNSSVAPVGDNGVPPAAPAPVVLPHPKICALPDAKSATSVHDEPSQNSVVAKFGVDPKINAAALPAPAVPCPLVPLFASFTSVQDVPFHVSVTVDGPLGG